MTLSASLVAVGDNVTKKSEKFEDGNWTDIQEPPVVGNYFGGYAVISHGGNHFFFGGRTDSIKELNSILRLSGSSWTWSNVGQLNSARRAHGAIVFGNTVAVAGGIETKNNELCLLENEQFTCTEHSSSLFDYSWYPILLPVDKTYGKC